VTDRDVSSETSDGEVRRKAPTGLAVVLAELSTPRDDGVHPLWAAMGGPRGLIESSIPTTAFIVANLIAGLRWAIFVALGLSLVLLAVRLVRRERPDQALSGLFAAGVAALIAWRLHSASGYFLPGILLQIPYAVVFIASVVARRPVVGYVAAVVSPALSGWRSEPILRRAASYATLAWAAVFIARIAVMVPLYLSDSSSALGVAKLAMGWPLWALAAGLSLLLIRRAAEDLVPAEDQDSPSVRPN